MDNGTSPLRDGEGEKRNRLPAFIRRNPGSKLLAAVFAVLLWVYVINVMELPRTKTITVPVYFQHLNELNEAGLVVANDPAGILKDIDITVEAKPSEIRYVEQGNVTAYVDLNDVRMAGKGQRLQIYTKPTHGQVVRVSTSFVTVDIDERATLSIPVDVQFEGALPEGYWRGEPVLTPAEIVLVGPKTEIEKLRSAVGVVSLDGRLQTLNEAVPITLIDTNGDVIDDSAFLDMSSSVGITMDIYPKKTVAIEIKDAVQGAPQAGFHVDTIQTSPGEIEIAGPFEILEGVTSIPVNMVNIEGKSEPVTTTRALQIPKGVVWSNFTSTSINVAISEDHGTDSYEDFQIEIHGLGRNLSATLSQDNVRMDVDGPLSQIRALNRRDITAYIDVSSLGAGIYTWPVSVALPEEAAGVTTTCVPSDVTVTISQE